MRAYRLRQSIVEAVQFCNDASGYELLHWANQRQRELGEPLLRWENARLYVPNTFRFAEPGDWIVRSPHGGLSVLTPAQFERTYEVDVAVEA